MTCAKGCCTTSAEHYRSLVMSGSPSVQAKAQRREQSDLEAYRRLRADGLQPRSHVGAAALEKAAFTPNEIETGTLIRNRRLANQAQRAADVLKHPETFQPLPEGA